MKTEKEIREKIKSLESNIKKDEIKLKNSLNPRIRDSWYRAEIIANKDIIKHLQWVLNENN